MAFTEKKLVQNLLTNAVVTYYTVPASTKAVVKSITVTGLTASEETIELWLVPSGGSPDNTNILLASTPVVANGGVICWDGYVTLETGDTIQAKASALTALTLTVGGAELV